jgi:hypothetical protein
MEKKLVDRIQRVEISGKRDRKVPVLLTKAMREEIDHLIANRHQVGKDENPYHTTCIHQKITWLDMNALALQHKRVKLN